MTDQKINEKIAIKKKKLLAKLLWLILFIFFINFFASFVFSWYWTIWWFDMFMHFLGGIWVSLAFLWLFYTRFVTLIGKEKTFTVFALVFFSVFAVAFLWEIFEFSIDTFITLKKQDIFDTLSDILLGLAGGMTGTLYFLYKIKGASSKS